MTTLAVGSAETGTFLSSSDGTGSGTTAPVFDTTTVRSGLRSFRCDGTSTNTSYNTGGPASGTISTYGWHQAWFYISTMPTAATTTIFRAGATTGPYIRLTSGGDVELRAGTASANDRTIGTLAAGVTAGMWFGLQIERRSNGATTSEIRAWYCTSDPTSQQLIGETSTATTAEATANTSGFALGSYSGWITAPGNTTSIYVDDVIGRRSGGWANRPSMWTRIIRAPWARVLTNTSSQWHTCRSTTYTESHTLEAANGLPSGGHADSTSDGTAHQHRNTSAASAGAPSILELETYSYGRMGIPGHCIVTGGGAGRQSVGDASARTKIAQGLYCGATIANVKLSLMKVGAPTDNLVVEIQSDSAGAPSGTALASATIDGSTLTTSVADYRIDLNAPTGTGVKVWIVLSRSGSVDGSNYYQVQTCSTASVYPDGGTAAHNGTSWGAVDTTATWVMEALNDSGQAWIVDLFGYIYQGEAVTTGTKTGSYKFSRPDAGSYTTFTYNDSGTAVGTWNTGWQIMPIFGGFSAAPGYPAMNDTLRYAVTKTDTGTRAVCVLGPIILIQYSEPLPGWNQFTKTSDSSVWWGKYAPTRMQWAEYPSGVETEFTVEAGQWVLAPDPLPDDGQVADFTVVDDATLKANYTPA